MPHEVEHEEEYEGEEEKSGVRFHASPEEEELEGDAGPGPLKRLALKKARCETSLLVRFTILFYFFFIHVTGGRVAPLCKLTGASRPALAAPTTPSASAARNRRPPSFPT